MIEFIDATIKLIAHMTNGRFVPFLLYLVYRCVAIKLRSQAGLVATDKTASLTGRTRNPAKIR